MAYMNREALEKTLETGEAYFYSRSRQELWHKGGTSGHVQKVYSISIDCDGDTLLLKAEQVGGGACHTGYYSCFYRSLKPAETILKITGTKTFDPDDVYGKK
jgi:phosphoribosyl-AMP cyclohydrolase